MLHLAKRSFLYDKKVMFAYLCTPFSQQDKMTNKYFLIYIPEIDGNELSSNM